MRIFKKLSLRWSNGFFELFTLRKVPFLFHWSACAVFLFFLLLSFFWGIESLILVFSYLSIMVFHELGHIFMAQRFYSSAYRVRIYAFFGITELEAPHSLFEEIAVSWGGILAQILILIPAFFLFHFWTTAPAGIRIFLCVASYFNLLWIGINLAPAKVLDGGKAWKIFPYYWKKIRNRK